MRRTDLVVRTDLVGKTDPLGRTDPRVRVNPVRGYQPFPVGRDLTFKGTKKKGTVKNFIMFGQDMHYCTYHKGISMLS